MIGRMRAGTMQPAMARATKLLLTLAAALLLSTPVALAASPSPPPPGPPFPDPIDNQSVYDNAGLFQPDTRTQAESIIDAIEAQTKAEVVVYTQALGRDDITPEEAEGHARALMDQWGVGRFGVNDGLVILFDLDTSLQHGQVQLFAGPGFSSAWTFSRVRSHPTADHPSAVGWQC